MATVKIKNIDSLINKLNGLANMDLSTVVKNTTLEVQGRAKALAPVGETGNLKGSIRADIKKKGTFIEGRVSTNLNYAPYVEFGTGSKGNGTYPHNIKDVNLTYRSTPWAFVKDDEVIWTNGQVAQPFMYPAVKGAEKSLRKLIKEQVKKEVK